MAKKRLNKAELDSFLQQERAKKLRAAQARAPKEVQLWQKWHDGGRRQKDLLPLMLSLENVVRSQSRQYGRGYGGSLVQGATELELRRYLKKAIETYTPGRGTKLSTWAVTQMRAFTGRAAKRRNFGSQSNKDFQATQQFNNAVNELKAQGTVAPSHGDLAKRLGWTPARVKRMDTGTMRRELYTGITPGQSDDVGGTPSQMRSIMSLMYFKNNEERKVFDALKLHAPDAAMEGALNMTQVARKLNMPLSRLYKIRDTLHKRVKPLFDRV